MDLTDLRKRAAKLGIPQAILEKDYVLSVVLLELSRSSLKKRLAFKGGTAIKKAYFQNARFSEDLDFTVLDGTENEIQTELKQLLDSRELLGVRFETLEQEKTNAGLRVALRFSAFLEHPQRIRFDFSFRENLFLIPVDMQVFDDYVLGNASMLVMPLEELLAEKIHATFSRTVARDLYDLWFLLKNGVNTDMSLLERKFSYYHEKYEPEKLAQKLDAFKPKWRRELEQFIPTLPEFDPLSKETLKLLTKTIHRQI